MYRFFIPIKGAVLWEKQGLNKLLFSDDMHWTLDFYHKILIPLTWLSFWGFTGYLLAILSY